MKTDSVEVDGPTRVVLEGVRPVGFGILEENRDAECCPFPSCLAACLEYLGEDYGFTSVEVEGKRWLDDNLYIHLMGTSGAAFRLSWKTGWHLDNPALNHISSRPGEPYRRAFEAVGYEHEWLDRLGDGNDEERFRQRIIESIGEHSRPVLGFGVVGPPACCIITGFDNGADILTGWSFFQGFPEFAAGLELEPSGYFRKQDWYAETRSLITIGRKRQVPERLRVYREALEWALQVVRTARIRQRRCNGLAAYEAWADALRQDDQFAAAEPEELRHRFMVHDDAVGTVAEGRWYASRFLEAVAAADAGLATQLLAAAECYRREHQLMWEVWELVGGLGIDDEKVARLAEPGVRSRIGSLILEARDHDTKAAGLIEQALGRSRSDDEPPANQGAESCGLEPT